MGRVAIVIPYFGRFPEWIELFLHSCGKNRMVDFIIYTDCEIPARTYTNTIFRGISFPDYCSMVSERLGIRFAPYSPYKLCDLKPFYGKIHEKELRGYDFWGFGDIDLVYGDLSPLINERNLRRYDILTTHSYHVAGHLTLARNNRRWRELCFRIKGWQGLLESDQSYGIDEGVWSGLAFPHLRYTRRIYSMIWSDDRHLFRYLDITNSIFCNHITRKHIKEYHTTPHPGVDGEIPERWSYDPCKGRVTGPRGNELIYLHFLFFKRTPWLDTERYWRPGFYRIDGADLENERRIVGIDHRQINIE